MAGYTKHVSSIKGAPRLRPCGLKTKTTQGIASNDWRKRATAASSTEASTKIHKQAYDPSDDVCIRLDLETDESFSGPQFRFPKEKKVAWENTVSAPVWQLLSSSSSTSGDDAKEVINVQLKQAKPILASVNGETIALPNRFSFDVVAANQGNMSPGPAVGELRRLNGFTAFRRISSQDPDDLFVELQKVVNGSRDVGNPATSVSSASSHLRESAEEPSVQGKQRHLGLGGSESSASEIQPSNASTVRSDEEELRFQRMLDRLQNNRRHPSPKPEAGVAAAPSRRIFDPAIMALKVKNEAEVLDRSIHLGQSEEAANTFFAQQLDQMRKLERQGSNDSGYGSTDRSDDTDGRSGAGLRIEQRLNPAAAKFKSAAQSDAAPWMPPKKMSRPPLTNIFPDAMLSHSITPHAAAKGNTPSRSSQPTLASTATAISHEHRLVNKSGNVEAPLSRSQPISRPFEFATPVQGAIPNGLPVGAYPGQIISHAGVAATMSAATMASPQVLTTTNLPATNAFNTFPPTAGLQLPVCTQSAISGVNVYPPHAVSFIPVTPVPVAIGSNGKPARPYFPVTTKPRDHDPVKQQLYEAYLEWRKANEPGYHMKCKMRQANRVMRQYQQQQDPTLTKDPANWKAIAERAKAAVGAAAAAAAEEKKRREELVRQEMKAKVKDLSRDSHGMVRVGA
ncbi:hypothetical protein MYCTH_2300215 [Thermothelomyces thermophilus ATCC 42464]|uniref:Uncharacterized protein n=1 Tax=Thermothelomyces thermophilus (strain ATCC 42464 / BCRC 31852 / DSM 1799) TaxID=573729 RepID=G2QAR2_THET4|nr:uncharacterized protein MYCTH_2300215 [Thermothelomyces thermophilus ATCC 42464]AEO55904.1 hypothetical protein MYCTH_2300215 [Thermothelomyces thermophilus ATCC 42464]